MADNRRIFMARVGSVLAIDVYEILKETAKMFKIEGLTEYTYIGQIHKDQAGICFSLEEARTHLLELVQSRIKGYEERLVEAKEYLKQIPQIEPKWRE